MKCICVWLLLGLFSSVHSGLVSETYYGTDLFRYYDGGDDYIQWCTADQACRQHGGILAMSTSGAINEVLRKLIIQYSADPRVWIGGNDRVFEQNWRWTDGSWVSSGYTNWLSGEPNDEKGEDCMEIFGSGKWNDDDCHEYRGYLCQIALTKTTKSDFVELSFSDLFPEGGKSVMSINEARTECENRNLKLIRDVSSDRVKKQIQKRLTKYTEAKFCADDGNHGRLLGADGMLDQECIGQPFFYICEGYRPHYIKITDEAPVVEKSGNIEIECLAEGYPVPEVTWHKNNEHVITTDTNKRVHQTMSSGSSTLVIENAEQGDEELYRCYATNNINGETHSSSIDSHLTVINNLN